MQKPRHLRFISILGGMVAGFLLVACGGPEEGETEHPAIAAIAAEAASNKAATCSVFGTVSGAVTKGVRIDTGYSCPDMWCGGWRPPPKSTTTNADGEFTLQGLLAGEMYVMIASRRGYTFDGAYRVLCQAGQVAGPYNFIAYPAATGTP